MERKQLSLFRFSTMEPQLVRSTKPARTKKNDKEANQPLFGDTFQGGLDIEGGRGARTHLRHHGTSAAAKRQKQRGPASPLETRITTRKGKIESPTKKSGGPWSSCKGIKKDGGTRQRQDSRPKGGPDLGQDNRTSLYNATPTHW